MPHLPSIFGIPEWPLSFDRLGLPVMLLAIVAVALLGALLLLPRRRARGAADSKRPIHRRRPWRIAATRPPQRSLRRIV
jgi:hypothetical protein